MVSAIISAYKGADKYLESRLDNLLTQMPAPEIIVVCQKGSAEFSIAIRHTSLNIKVVTTEDIPTVYEAWNLGIQASTGEFITNANSDDVLYDGALEYLEQALVDNPDIALVYANSDIVKEYKGMPVNRYVWMEGGFEELLDMCFIGPMPVWRRSLHEKYGFFDEEMRASGDYEFWLRIASSGEKFLHLNRCVGAFLSHKGSASMREPVRSTWETARARSRYINKEL